MITDQEHIITHLQFYWLDLLNIEKYISDGRMYKRMSIRGNRNAKWDGMYSVKCQLSSLASGCPLLDSGHMTTWSRDQMMLITCCRSHDLYISGGLNG